MDEETQARSHDVELVALGISHSYCVVVQVGILVHMDCSRSELGQSSNLGIDALASGAEWNTAAAAGLNVEMEPVLDRLGFRNRLEPDARAVAARVDDAVVADIEVLLGQPDITPVVVPRCEAGGASRS